MNSVSSEIGKRESLSLASEQVLANSGAVVLSAATQSESEYACVTFLKNNGLKQIAERLGNELSLEETDDLQRTT